jgi:hypothetical protein
VAVWVAELLLEHDSTLLALQNPKTLIAHYSQCCGCYSELEFALGAFQIPRLGLGIVSVSVGIDSGTSVPPHIPSL